MKSISQGRSMWRIRSARKRTAPLSTPTMKRSRPAYSSVIWRPSSATRFCSSSLETRVSPIEGSVTPRSLDRAALRRSALGAQHAALDHGTHAAAKIKHRGAGAAQARDLVSVVSGAWHGPAGGPIGEPLDDETAQGRWELRQAAQLDCAALRTVCTELGVDERVEHLGLVAQQLGRAQDVARGGRVDLGKRRGKAMANAIAGVAALRVGWIVPPGEPALFAVGGRLRTGESH